MGSVKHVKKKTRRGLGKKNIRKSNKFTIVGTNADGISTKKESFLNLIQNEKPSCFMVQETKLKKIGQLKVKGYQLFESVRKDRNGGGLVIGIDNAMDCEPVLVSVGDNDVEILVVEIDIKIMKIRLITAYGPQEDASDEAIKNFYARFEEEIDSSESNNCETIIELDCNAKLGKEIIKNDPKEMSDNGKVLFDIVKRRNLFVANSSEKCQGVITRRRETRTNLEESVIDYVIVSENVSKFIDKMEIDEDRTKVLTKFASKNGAKKLIKSDHNILKCEFLFSAPKRGKCRNEVYTLRNENNLKEFKVNTENAKDLIEFLDKEDDVKVQGNKFMKFLKDKIHDSFKKVQVDKTKKAERKTDIDKKLDERTDLRKQIVNASDAAMKHKMEDKLDDLEEEISTECSQKHFEMVSENIKQVSDLEGGFNTNKMWKLKRKIVNRGSEPLCAKKDLEGNMVTNPQLLKKLYLDTFVDRLHHREINPRLDNLKKLREDLFELRLERAKSNKSSPWEMCDLDKVLGNLKTNKAIDPTGLVNELFVPENIGHDLKKSLLLLINDMKKKGIDPDFMLLENIVCLYKGKGPRDELENERGIFILNIIRNIKDRLVYNDIYDQVEQNMSDSQVGAQRDKGIRNHLFILYSIINSVKQKECRPIDIQVYDVKKCFDALWLLECCNNLYEYGVRDDKLSMIYEGNRIHKIAVKTPAGLTDRVTVDDVIAQGSVIGPTCAAVQVDTIGKDAMEDNKHLYMYKKVVGIPPLGMIDDVANVAECGVDSVMDNAYIVAKFEQLKLELNGSKCHQMHVGKGDVNCPTLKSHNDDMDVVLEEKYLGDIVTCDGKHSKNVKSRCSKCIGVMTDIINMVKVLCLGHHFFKVSVILRQAMFLSVMLLNAETWLRLSQSDIKQIETTDVILMRKILEAPSTTPIPALYCELGLYPARFSIKSKRAMFLHHLLKRDKDEMISKVFWAQVNNPAKGDWCLVVLEDLDALGLGYLTLNDIEKKSKYQMKKLVKEATKKAALKYLLNLKENMSKMKDLEYSDLQLQPYLSSDKINIRLKKLLFKLRTRMTQVGHNFGKKVVCQVCKLPNTQDDQKHLLLECVKVKVENTHEVKYEDLFSDNVEKMSNAVQLFDIVYRKRTELMENNTSEE